MYTGCFGKYFVLGAMFLLMLVDISAAPDSVGKSAEAGFSMVVLLVFMAFVVFFFHWFDKEQHDSGQQRSDIRPCQRLR